MIIKNSIDDDLNSVYDRETGLVKGESSFSRLARRNLSKMDAARRYFRKRMPWHQRSSLRSQYGFGQHGNSIETRKTAGKYSQNAERIKLASINICGSRQRVITGSFCMEEIIKYYQNVQRHWAKHCVFFGIAGEERQNKYCKIRL